MLQSFLQLLSTSEDDAVIDIDPTLQTLDTICTNAVNSQHDMPMTLDWWIQTHTILYTVCQGDNQSIEQAIQWSKKFLRDGMSADHAGTIFHTVATFIMGTEPEDDLKQTALSHALSQAPPWNIDEVHTKLKAELFPSGNHN
ncbi:MAG: hypothetical protein H6925_04565 [Holosporaceae bacterium]|nr:MAG: hypothetical protein H6925_04565 [Holosporaceae bacterium]